MSRIIIEDAAWQAIMADARLAAARRKLSFHEIRLIVQHVRDSDGTAIAAANEDLPVPQDCQARAEGIAENEVSKP